MLMNVVGANTEAKDNRGDTPLYYAVADKNMRLIHKLLKYSTEFINTKIGFI